MIKRKYIFIGFSNDKLEKSLEQYSKQGWHFDKNLIYFFRLKKGEEKNYQYKFIYDKKFNKEIEQYYNEAGWQIISNGGFYRLARGEEGSTPIFTDIDSELEIMKYQSIKFLIIFIIGIISVLYGRPIIKNIENFTLGIVLSGITGGVSGIGLGGIILFLPKYIKLTLVKKSEED